jgi:hypothetical protein
MMFTVGQNRPDSTKIADCPPLREIGILGNQRAESSSSFSFAVASRTRTVRREARQKLGKKLEKINKTSSTLHNKLDSQLDGR